MADAEKYSSDSGSAGSRHREEIFERPKGLKGLYSHTATQVAMLGFVCFMGPGLFNALNGLGGGGQLDTKTSANANVALYSTFAVMAFFAGTVNNIIGPRYTLLVGSMGYSLYIGSYLAMNIHADAGPFVVAAGAILGICAGLLWTAQGSLMLSYPTEQQKGRFIGIFWTIFNLGGVVGASVSLGTNFESTAGSVGNSTYIAFLVLTGIGVAIPMLMVNPKTMIRSDGTKVATPRHPSWKTEILGLYVTLKTDPMILLLFPMFLASNWFYTWQFNDYNAGLFNIRARALNNLVYWIAQVIGSVAIGLLLDQPRLSRRVRAFAGWAVLFVMVFFVHIWAYFYQKRYTRDDGHALVDIYDSGYAGYILCYVFMGILDAMWQTTSYWLMGAMSNDAAKLAHFAGFYKSLQSAGAAIAWRIDALKTPYMNLFISEWVLLVAGLLFTLPMMHLRVKNQTTLEEETLARMDDAGHIAPVEEVKKKIGEA
ncbi:MFS general substrate transporter [Schizophyllum commune H4-8]|uniref:Major facilitator superfamily (MFS) profile domain-containing protein n=1 Tax=Schizophyllum commune (strain H4-8 / FGSC 9210) TaxID=578458 RepID=D8Q714_SCHCM|nr:MFS general substrate transporter [Schizophyllum commune H4-8]KAI5891680.1 MFS general substrate transporter [Schizophyllum commune H4-8]